MSWNLENLSRMNINYEIKGIEWGQIVYKPQSTLGPRRQTTQQLVLVHSGSIDVCINERWYRIDGGETGLLYPGNEETFRFSPDRQTHHSWIHFIPGEGASGAAYPSDEPGILPTSPRVAFAVGELLGIRHQNRAVAPGPARALGELALYDTLERLGRLPGEGHPHHPVVDRALSYMQAHYNESIDLKALTRVCGMSSQQLTRLFKEQIGHTPIRQLWRIREEAGRRLLRETGLSAAEIAEASGFANPYHFTRRIRERYGASPRILRRRDWSSLSRQ